MNIFNNGKIKSSVITINGTTYHGSSITMKNGKVIVDGEEVKTGDAKTINISVNGDITNLEVDACNELQVTGSVGSLRTISGDVTVTGDVDGSVQSTSGDIECGHVQGSVQTVSGDVKCGAVGGNVKTLSGDVRHK